MKGSGGPIFAEQPCRDVAAGVHGWERAPHQGVASNFTSHLTVVKPVHRHCTRALGTQPHPAAPNEHTQNGTPAPPPVSTPCSTHLARWQPPRSSTRATATNERVQIMVAASY
jgi:hypothetical protein